LPAVDIMARRTTLQRLQKLEEDFTTFESKLGGLCDILGAPTLLTQDPAEHVPQTKTADGRLDWALRWILNKLQGTETGSAEYVKLLTFAEDHAKGSPEQDHFLEHGRCCQTSSKLFTWRRHLVLLAE